MLLHSPIIQPGKKQPILKKVFTGVFHGLMLQFVDVLLRKHREMYLPDIVTAFLDQYNQAKHIEEVKITTAVPVDDALLKQISDSLHQEGDLAIQLETAVDPDIIGGYVIQYGGLLYDASVARNLRRLRKAFDDNEYVRKF
jgi:F-type H+-transporting ATPase subunit delta